MEGYEWDASMATPTPPGSREKNRAKERRAQNTRTHELLKIFPILPVETPIGLPDPIPSRVMPRPGREEDDGIVSLNLAAEVQSRSIRSIIGKGNHTWGRRGTIKDRRNGTRNRRSDNRDGVNASVSILIACTTFRQGDQVTHHTN